MIALAGGIGSGKSVVARILRLKGYGVFDCDFEARCLMESEPVLVDFLKRLAGEDVFVNGSLQRRRLASRFYGDPALRREVNAAVHSAVRDSVRRWLALSDLNLFVESAIAAQSGIIDMADAVWLVVAPLDVRVDRVIERDNRSYDEVRSIVGLQCEEEALLRTSGKPVVPVPNGPSDFVLQFVNYNLYK